MLVGIKLHSRTCHRRLVYARGELLIESVQALGIIAEQLELFALIVGVFLFFALFFDKPIEEPRFSAISYKHGAAPLLLCHFLCIPCHIRGARSIHLTKSHVCDIIVDNTTCREGL